VWAIERTIGRLVEIRIWSPVSLEETYPWSKAHDHLIDAIRGPYICFVDLRDATVFPQPVVEGYVRTMKNEQRLLRTGTLLNESPTLGMQIQRMIKEANNPARRSFRDPDELHAWMAELLDPEELARLRMLLDHPVISSRRSPDRSP
jgi:hypothetical protein